MTKKNKYTTYTCEREKAKQLTIQKGKRRRKREKKRRKFLANEVRC